MKIKPTYVHHARTRVPYEYKLLKEQYRKNEFKRLLPFRPEFEIAVNKVKKELRKMEKGRYITPYELANQIYKEYSEANNIALAALERLTEEGVFRSLIVGYDGIMQDGYQKL